MSADDWGHIIDTTLAALAALLSGIAAFTAARTRGHVQQIHLQINSRMDALLQATEQLGVATGREAQRTGNGGSVSMPE